MSNAKRDLYSCLCTFEFAYSMAYAKRDFMHLPWFMHWLMHIQICISHGLCTHKKKAKKKVSGGGDFDEDCNMHLHKPWVMHQKRILKKPCKNCLYLPWQIQIQNTHAWTMVNANWKKTAFTMGNANSRFFVFTMVNAHFKMHLPW